MDGEMFFFFSPLQRRPVSSWLFCIESSQCIIECDVTACKQSGAIQPSDQIQDQVGDEVGEAHNDNIIYAKKTVQDKKCPY